MMHTSPRLRITSRYLDATRVMLQLDEQLQKQQAAKEAAERQNPSRECILCFEDFRLSAGRGSTRTRHSPTNPGFVPSPLRTWCGSQCVLWGPRKRARWPHAESRAAWELQSLLPPVPR